MKDRRIYFLLLLLVILFFSADLIRGRGFYYGDNLSHQIPTLSCWKNEVLSGQLPLWNPYILGGLPHFADLSHNSLAPTNFIYLLLPVPIAIRLITMLFIWISSVFTYKFVHHITQKDYPSLFSAIAFSFSGTMIAAVNDINSLQGIALIPLVICLTHNLLEKPNIKNSLMLICSLVFQFISSHPQYTYYTWLLVAIYFIALRKYNLKMTFKLLLVIFLVTSGLIAVQLLPFLEYSKQVYRPQTPEFASQNQLQIIEIPKFVIANIYGTWRSGTSWGPGSQLETGLANSEGYLGILPLVFAVYATYKNKSKQNIFWAITVAITLLMSLGNATPFFSLLLKILPFFSKFRSPIRILSIYSFALAILAGLGLEKALRKIK